MADQMLEKWMEEKKRFYWAYLRPPPSSATEWKDLIDDMIYFYISFYFTSTGRTQTSVNAPIIFNLQLQPCYISTYITNIHVYVDCSTESSYFHIGYVLSLYHHLNMIHYSVASLEPRNPNMASKLHKNMVCWGWNGKSVSSVLHWALTSTFETRWTWDFLDIPTSASELINDLEQKSTQPCLKI